LASAVALGFALALGCVLGVRLGLTPDPTRRLAPPVETSSFGLSAAANPLRPEAKFDQAVFLSGSSSYPWFGTYVNGDSFTGRATSTRFVVENDVLDIPILGYPHAPGNSLDLEVLDRTGKIVFSRRYAGPNPREIPGHWLVATPGLRGASARLVLRDGETAPGGWLAVARPIPGEGRAPAWLWGVRRDYGWFGVSAVALAALLFLPGLAWHAWRRGAAPASAPGIAVPGLVMLALFGGGIWLLGPGTMRYPALAWLAMNAAAALGLARKWWREGGAGLPGEGVSWRVYGWVVVGALAFAVLPLPVAQEFEAHTTAQARMIASPPDHGIPFQTASYFYHQLNGREASEVYFGPDWSVTSRGPLAALAVAGGFAFLGGPRSATPGLSLEAWPASADGFYVARLLGILTNALVILAAAALAARLAPGAERLAVCWFGVAPAIAIDTDFLWPKLLATFFLLIAIRLVVEGRAARWIGVALAFAYFSHPLGGLLAPPVVLYLLQRVWASRTGSARARGRAALGAGGAATGWLLLCLIPWLIYKRWVGHPDVFYQYPWGDGRGFARAIGWASWLKCRWANLWLTVTPGGFYLSANMQGWLEGPLAPPLRWAIGYAKTLPGGLGLGCFLVACASLTRRVPPVLREMRASLIGGALALMLVFWGFSSDGLGRNCLTPLAAILMIYAVAVFPRWNGWPWLLALTALETLSVRLIGILGAADFTAREVNGEAVVLGGLVLIATLAPLALLLAIGRRSRSAGADRRPGEGSAAAGEPDSFRL
jgi:hypothetical protein